MNYARFAIFHGISDGEVEAMIQCFGMRRGRFTPGETIRVYGGSRDVGVVVRGAAELVRFDRDGNRTILERMETGGVFGELLVFSAELGDSLEVIAAGECEVLFMDYAAIMKRCERACRCHSQLVENLFCLMAGQARQLSRQVFVANRINAAVVHEALSLLEKGIASVEDIDTACEKGLNYPMGPFRLMDLTGIDVNYYVRVDRYAESHDSFDAPNPLVIEKFKKGEFGKKTGKGWYDYTDAK